MSHIDDLYRQKNWNKELFDSLEENIQKEETASSYIQMLFACWYLLLEGGIYIHTQLSNEFLTEKLHHYYDLASKKFMEDDRFKFYAGWMMQIAFLYFGNEYEDVGEQLIWDAHQINKQDPLYQWANAEKLNLDRNEYASKIPENQFADLGYGIKEYFTRLVTSK